MPSFRLPRSLCTALVLAAGLLAACSSTPMAPWAPVYEGPPRQETVWALAEPGRLLRFTASEPGRIQAALTVRGLAPGERLLGIDFRVARGVLYGLGSTGRLYTLDRSTGVATPLGSAPFAVPLQGSRFGFDFNPAADRIRIVSDAGQNLRAHPDTGALVDNAPDQPGVQPDGALAYAAGDAHAGRAPRIEAAGYTYNPRDDKLTTNYAIDAALGILVTQGSVEGRSPVVSPNTGQLRTVGPLGVGPVQDVSLDISDVGNVALAVFGVAGDPAPVLHVIDLASGQARRIGVIGDGAAVTGLAIEP